MDFISMVWDIMNYFGFTPYLAFPVITFLFCITLPFREYGKTFFTHLLHRRNLPHVCGILLFFCTFWLLSWFGIFSRFPVWTQVLLILLYGIYIFIVLRSVKAPTLFSGHYLRRYQTWLKRGESSEHIELIEKMPWYFFDQDEKLSYRILRAKYLYEQGNYVGSYHAYTEINRQLLYPEEHSEIAYSMAVLLIELGNLPKATEVIKPLSETNPPAFFAFQSYLDEQQGNMDKAYSNAMKGEISIPQNYKSCHTLIALYTQLGRLNCFRNNTTELFRYYRLALEEAHHCQDLRLYHITYQNLLAQIQICHMHEDEFNRLMSEYMDSMKSASLKNQMELENFRISMARQKGDKILEYKSIRDGYLRLHTMAEFPNKCVVEVSALAMLVKGDHPIDCILSDIKEHFDSYFNLPMPARIVVVQQFLLPQPRSEDEAILYSEWTQKLIDYATNHALADLDEYERGLSTDNVNERCWVQMQRIDFIRRTQEHYNGDAILRSMRDIIQIYECSGQIMRTVNARITLVKEYEELIGMGQQKLDQDALNDIRQIISTAYRECLQVPEASVAVSLIDIAYFSAKFGDSEQSKAAFKRFQNSRVSPRQFSQKVKMEYNFLSYYFAEGIMNK